MAQAYFPTIATNGRRSRGLTVATKYPWSAWAASSQGFRPVMPTLQQSTERLKTQFYLHDEIRLAVSAALLHKHARTQTPPGRAAK